MSESEKTKIGHFLVVIVSYKMRSTGRLSRITLPPVYTLGALRCALAARPGPKLKIRGRVIEGRKFVKDPERLKDIAVVFILSFSDSHNGLASLIRRG